MDNYILVTLVYALIPLCKGCCLIGMLIRMISHFIYTQLSHPYTHKTEKLCIKFTCIKHLKPIEVSDCKGDYFKFQICCYGKPQLYFNAKSMKRFEKSIRSIKISELRISFENLVGN